jgi:GTP 3',8-cyclase
VPKVLAEKYHIDGHKLFWHLDRVRQWQEGRVIPPVYVEVSPTALCNHKCIFCGLDFKRGQFQSLDTAIFCKRLKEMGKLGVRSIMFAGEGEPLLHKGLPLFIRTAKKAGIDVSLVSNGELGNYRTWKTILPYLTWVRFSVDAGTPGVFSRIHRVSAESFHKTIQSIREAKKVKSDLGLGVTIGVQFLIVEENLRDIENALKLFSGIGLDYISLKPYSLHPQMLARKNVVYSTKTMQWIQAIVDRCRNKSKTAIIFRNQAMQKYIEKEKAFTHCRALPFWGYVSSDGNFYTCSVFLGDRRFSMGSIYKKDMKSIFFGSRRRRSLQFGAHNLNIGKECRLNCRMARINEFLEFIDDKPQHLNFI